VSDKHFDEIAAVYDESLPAHVVEHYLRKRVAYVREHCPRGRGLDVGCGTGALAARLAGSGYDMVGVDPSAGMLEVLRRRFPHLQVAQAPGTALPFPDDDFDLVCSVAVMHHLEDPHLVRATLAEMVRVARPGGRVLVWDHNPRNPYWGRLMAKVPQDTGSERLVPERELVRGLEAAGAHVRRSDQLGMVPDFMPAKLMGTAAILERAVERMPLVRLLAAHNVVLGVKRGGQRPS
jgi:SAM-dependent methyltransferase